MPKENFATSGTESYKLEEEEKKKGIVLNIEEEKPSEAASLLLGKQKPTELGTGNIFIDTFNNINQYFVKKSKVKIDAKANFFHLLSVMINSGIPMVKALKSLESQTEKSPKLKLILGEIVTYVEEGSKFSEALAGYPDVFTEQEIGMVQSGEASGQLSMVLENLARDTEKAYKIRAKVKSAMTYPIVIFTLLIAVVTVMMVYVVPQLTELFASSGQELPTITKIVIAISDFMVNKKILLISIVVGLVIGIIAFKKTKTGKYFFDQLKLKLPIFGKLFQKSFLSRFARSLSNLLESRISIVRAMEITAKSIGNEVYKKRLLLSVEDIKQGIPIAESLTESVLFPPMLVNMLEVGEQTAQVDTIAAKVADFYEDEVDTAVEGISKIIEPVILIVIGLTVGGVIAAIMLPIMKLSNIAGSI